MHQAGFVSIIGYPNVGKSTLMNALLGERLSIITPKAQTTRHRIMGIFSDENFQIVYSDTPGVIKPHYKLHRAMMSAVFSALDDADVILLVTEAGNDFHQEEILKKLKETTKPVIVVINKIDLGDMEVLEKEAEKWRGTLDKATILPVSALHKVNLDQVFKAILHDLPESPPFYPKDELTDRSQRFFISEIIREKILLYFSQEIPYSTEVAIESFKEEEHLTRISATIYVSRESQKGILIGHQGVAIKKLGTVARKDIESFLGQHVFLELRVKVAKDWREDDQALKRFGYPSTSEK
ncbi:MAG: GTPase Era [Bacteroidales bacterium]|nr:GTPase Era [Bacteroidales bacterium]MDD4603705.1 GTPase Era [Bacteroidales bacterium]